jgi:thiol-disulfide isomerase/thioredoxin
MDGADVPALEAAFASAYRQKFAELLKQSCSTPSSSCGPEVSARPRLSSALGANLVNVRLSEAPVPLRAPPGGAPAAVKACLALLLLGVVVFATCRFLQSRDKDILTRLHGGSLVASIESSLPGVDKTGGLSSPRALTGAGGVPKTGPQLVMFFSDRCPHCTNAKPHYAKLAAVSKKASCSVCDSACLAAFPDAGRSLAITGFPTFVGFVDGLEVGRVVGAPRGGEAELIASCEGLFAIPTKA